MVHVHSLLVEGLLSYLVDGISSSIPDSEP